MAGGRASASTLMSGGVDEAFDPAQLMVGIEITRRCNLCCPHCFTASGGVQQPEPTTEMLRQLLADLAAAKVCSGAFSGGEPLMRKDLGELIRFGRDAGIANWGIVTNGFFATQSLVRELADAGLGTVQVSVDGVDAMDHARVRGCGRADFYRALRAIRLFREHGMNVHVATLLSPRNVERVAEMALLVSALGAIGLRYCTFVPTGRATSSEQANAHFVSHDAMDKFISVIRSLNEERSANLSIAIDHAMGPWSGRGTFSCESGIRVAYVSVDGSLYPCPSLMAEPFRVGNVFDTPIGELLTSPRMGAARAVSRQQMRGPCASCTNEACRGGCRGLAFAVTGDVCGAIPYCHFEHFHRGA